MPLESTVLGVNTAGWFVWDHLIISLQIMTCFCHTDSLEIAMVYSSPRARSDE